MNLLAKRLCQRWLGDPARPRRLRLAAAAAAAGGGCGPAAAAGGGRSGGWRLTHGAVEPISGHVGCCWICLDMPSAVERVPAYTLDECL